MIVSQHQEHAKAGEQDEYRKFETLDFLARVVIHRHDDGERGAEQPQRPSPAGSALLARERRSDLDPLLLVSGLGKAADRFRERADRAGVLAQVRFLPYLPHEDLIAVYAGADLCIYPSLVEGWGIPVTEALVLGTPILTSNTSAMPEAGGEHARYFDPHDVDSMASAMLAAADDYLPAWPTIRDAAVARARGFTWRSSAERALDAYRAAADRGR